jgi:hypothetical protein
MGELRALAERSECAAQPIFNMTDRSLSAATVENRPLGFHWIDEPGASQRDEPDCFKDQGRSPSHG